MYSNLYDEDETHCCREYLQEEMYEMLNDSTNWEALIDALAALVHGNKMPDVAMWAQQAKDIASQLFTQFWDSYTKTYGKIAEKWDMKDINLLAKVHDNLFTFSGAKTMTELGELKNAVYENGKLLPWTEYRQRAKAINQQYNITYLEAERNSVMISGAAGSRWVEIERTKHLYPYVQYKTQGDKRVRPEHARLDGMIFAVDSPMALKVVPPNGWRCRCWLVQLTEEQAKAIGITDESVLSATFDAAVKDTYWHQNPGSTGLVFPPEHQYWNNLDAASKKQVFAEARDRRNLDF